LSHQFSKEEVKRAGSPFKRVNDAEIFLIREKNKFDGASTKEENLRKKIWEKTTATTRCPLQKVREEDVLPAK
jgi:hypothetical protein